MLSTPLKLSPVVLSLLFIGACFGPVSDTCDAGTCSGGNGGGVGTGGGSASTGGGVGTGGGSTSTGGGTGTGGGYPVCNPGGPANPSACPATWVDAFTACNAHASCTAVAGAVDGGCNYPGSGDLTSSNCWGNGGAFCFALDAGAHEWRCVH